MEVREKMCVHALPVMLDSAQSISSLFSISAVCSISAFAFGCYGGWLVGALNSDFEGGFSMGRVATELIARIENLRLFPTMGRAVELAPDPKAIRDAVFGKYVIRYATHTETVVILRIWHHYEDRMQSI